MGNYAAKNLWHNMESGCQRQEKEEKNHNATAESTPRMHLAEQSAEKRCEQSLDMQTPKEKVLPLDPRSATLGITRTPIEVDSTPVRTDGRLSAIPKHLRVKQRYLETDIDKVMPRLTPKKRCIPRIAKPTEISETASTNANLQNLESAPGTDMIKHRLPLTPIEKDRYKILGIDPRSPAANFDRTPILVSKLAECEEVTGTSENLSRRGSYETDYSCSSFCYCETSSQFVNVPEIQALPDMVTRALKSINLDDIGVVNRHSESGKSSSSLDSDTDTFSGNEDDEADDTCSEQTINSEKILPGIQQTNLESNKVESENEMAKMKPDNLKIIIWNDSSSSGESDAAESESTESSNESIIVKPSNPGKNSCSRKNVSKAEYDIYPQNNKYPAVESISQKIQKKAENEALKARVPLKNRLNNGQERALSSKSPQQLLRNKGINRRMMQENTPPHKSCVKKSKLTGVQWDADSTVLI